MTAARDELSTAASALTSAKRIARAVWDARSWFLAGLRKYRHDERYDLAAVRNGFRDRLDDHASDEALLLRICRAYSLAAVSAGEAHASYQASEWWQRQRETSLGPIMKALSSCDIPALQRMYSNFFRDDCATGLLPVQRMKGGYFSESVTNFHRRLYLINALYRLDYWRTQTDSEFTERDLAGPVIGNPFGVMMGETLIRSGSEYQHYCAHRIATLLPATCAVVAEIGGGFGGMAYYLLRDRPTTTYIDFDLPESIALTSYYLIKAFPDLKFLLYGEAELNEAAIGEVDVLLMPVHEMGAMPKGVVDLTFSSHSISDLSSEAMERYLENIACMTAGRFLYVGNAYGARSISSHRGAMMQSGFTPLETRGSYWNHHLAPQSVHVEYLHSVNGADEPEVTRIAADEPLAQHQPHEGLSTAALSSETRNVKHDG